MPSLGIAGARLSVNTLEGTIGIGADYIPAANQIISWFSMENNNTRIWCREQDDAAWQEPEYKDGGAFAPYIQSDNLEPTWMLGLACDGVNVKVNNGGAAVRGYRIITWSFV